MSVPVLPERSGLVPVEVGRVYAIDRGPMEAELPPLVLLHGLLVTHHSFRRLIDPIARTRRVIAIDLPGCGESDRPPPHAAGDYSLTWLAGRVQEALGALGVERYDLLAHSFGGAVAVQLVTTEPLLTRRLMLVDAVTSTIELPFEGRMALLPRLGPLLFTQLYRRADLHRYLSKVFSTPELLDEDAVDVYWDRLARRGGREAAYAMLLQMSRLDALAERVARVPVPTMVVWGDRDGIVPLSTGEQLAQRLPDAELTIVEGCGHAVPEERPEALCELVEGFLGPGPS